MWVGTVSFCEMRKRSRWRVELFCNRPPQRRQSKYQWVPLGQLVDERQESLDPQEYPDRLFNYLGLENVEGATGDRVGFEAKYGKEVRSRSKIFREGDVLYGRLRPYLNKVHLASGKVANGICSGEFYVLVPRLARVRPLLLRSLLASRYVHPHVAALQTGSALPRLELEDLMEIEVPLPDLNEQESFHRFLLEQDSYRRRLTDELTRLPDAVLNALADALESGSEPIVQDAEPSEEASKVDPNPLPGGRFTSRKRKSRHVEVPFPGLLD